MFLLFKKTAKYTEDICNEQQFIDLNTLETLPPEKQYEELTEFFSKNPENHRNLSAIYIISKACINLGKYSEVEQWCKEGLDIKNGYTNYPDEEVHDLKNLFFFMPKHMNLLLKNGIKPYNP